jgi:hypothetical protein
LLQLEERLFDDQLIAPEADLVVALNSAKPIELPEGAAASLITLASGDPAAEFSADTSSPV